MDSFPTLDAVGRTHPTGTRIDFDYVIRRKALESDNVGWRRYPVSMIGILEGQEFSLEMGLEILYSSTCPCSAALARQLVQDQFKKDFDASKTLGRG